MSLIWKPANKRQQEQYWCGPNALVARVNKATLTDRNAEMVLTCEIIVTGDTVMFHYEPAGNAISIPELDYIFHFEKQVTGLEEGVTAAQNIFNVRLCGDTLIQAGYKETY